jgi:hypothetical protein
MFSASVLQVPVADAAASKRQRGCKAADEAAIASYNAQISMEFM